MQKLFAALLGLLLFAAPSLAEWNINGIPSDPVAGESLTITGDATVGGKLGLGLTDPVGIFTIKPPTGDGIHLHQPDGVRSVAALKSYADGASFHLYNGTTTLFSMDSTSGTQKTYWLGGNWGFGTSDPQTKLHLYRVADRADFRLERATTSATELGAVQFHGLDSASTTTTYAQIVGKSITTTHGVERGALSMELTVNGSSTEKALLENDSFTAFGKVRMTSLGGLAIKLTAGEDLAAGELVRASGAADDTALKTTISDDMPMGVVYAAATTGNSVWVVVQGIAEVQFDGATTPARGHIAFASGATAGTATSSASLPTVAEHNREIGHVIQSAGAAGAKVRCVLHFN